jgi:hypothetical protein
VPVPIPTADEVDLAPPSAEEAILVSRGIIGAAAPAGGPTELQRALIPAICRSLTGHIFDPEGAVPLPAEELAVLLARRDERYRTRIFQMMLLNALTLHPLPVDVVERLRHYAQELCVDDGMLAVAQSWAEGSLELAVIDFERNGYTADWTPERAAALHTSGVLTRAWDQVCHDPELAARWHALEDCPPGSLGRRVWEFYRARGFTFPGEPDSAPPYLAQHDWMHVLADYGTSVSNEVEVFTLIGRATDDMRGFSLVTMVISLFETGYLESGAGLFRARAGHMSGAGLGFHGADLTEGMGERVADAMLRGKSLEGHDLLELDWFEFAEQSVAAVQAQLGLREKSRRARAFGSCGPFEPGGISEFQIGLGRKLAEAEGREYLAYGAIEV